MDLQRNKACDSAERLAHAIRQLSEVQAILETANYDIAAAYIQMAVDHCGEPQQPAAMASVFEPDSEIC